PGLNWKPVRAKIKGGSLIIWDPKGEDRDDSSLSFAEQLKSIIEILAKLPEMRKSVAGSFAYLPKLNIELKSLAIDSNSFEAVEVKSGEDLWLAVKAKSQNFGRLKTHLKLSENNSMISGLIEFGNI